MSLEASAQTNPSAQRQTIHRVRQAQTVIVPAKTLQDFIIPEVLRKSLRGEQIYFDDSGQDDPHRIVIYATPSNIELLRTNQEWFVDGTFDIAPTVFYQVIELIKI